MSAITYFLSGILPPEAIESIHVNIVHPHAPFQVFKRQVLVQAQRAFNVIYPFIQPLADRVLALAAENQGAVGLVASVFLLVVIVSIVIFVQRLIMWCTRLALRVVFWASVFAVVAWAWQRGPLETVKDTVVVGSKIAGFLTGVGNHWLQEYDRYEAQQTAHSARGGRGRSSGR